MGQNRDPRISSQAQAQQEHASMPGSMARPPIRVIQEQRRGDTHKGELTEGARRRHLGGGIVIIAEVVATQAPPSSRPRQRGSSSTAMVERPSPVHHRNIDIWGAPGLQVVPSNRQRRSRSSRKAPRRRSNSPRQGRR
jgi:hypothetical protein